MNEMEASSLAPELWLSLIKSAGMLCIVIGIMLGVLYLIKRLSGFKGVAGSDDGIQVISSRYLAAKTKLMIVHVAGEKLLLGVTPQSINLITKITAEEGASLEKEKVPAGFGEMFRMAVGGKRVLEETGEDHGR